MRPTETSCPTPAGTARAELPRAAVQVPESVLFGYAFSAVDMARVLGTCRDAVVDGRRLAIGVANAAKVVKMRDDPLLRDSVTGSDLVLADGMSLVWAGRLLRRRLPERVAGIDIFTNLLAQAEELGGSVYLLGATDEVQARMHDRIRELHPRLTIAGWRNGYFDDAEEPEVAEAIRRSGANYLFVGITSPKKERFLGRWWHTLGVNVCHGVGGSFDVLSGKVDRAPEIWQRLGMEWLYRVRQEPGRLWKRYLVTNCAFGWLLLREMVRRTPRYDPPRSS